MFYPISELKGGSTDWLIALPVSKARLGNPGLSDSNFYTLNTCLRPASQVDMALCISLLISTLLSMQLGTEELT